MMFCFFLSMIILSGCKKDNPSHTQQEVENYIRQLRQGTYKKLDMPEFSQEAIPYLLAYRNEEDFISNFPRNPISSYLLKNVDWEFLFCGR